MFDKSVKPYIKFNKTKLIVKATPTQVKRQLADHGVSIREWAAARGFSESLVYAVLAGKNKASRGASFQIAVALGLKQAPSVDEAPQYVVEALQHRTAHKSDRYQESTMT